MALAIDAVRKLYGLIDVYAIALDDLPAGTKATGTITLTGTVTQAGTLYAYIGGIRVSCAANYNDSNATLATSLAAAINANANIPATAAAAAGVVTVTARHKGTTSNDMELAVSYYEDDTLPQGITAVCANLATGTGDPDVGTALAVITEDWYYSIVAPYTDSANLVAIEADMDGRWGGMNMKTGHIFNAKDGTMAALTTWGATRNSPHGSTWGLNKCPTWTPERIAAFAATCEISGANDPAMPLRNLTVPGVMAPRLKDRFGRTERELLLKDGISTTTVDSGGKVILERVITNYQKNVQGVDDESLLRLETKWTVDYLRYFWRSIVALEFPRAKLADNGTKIKPGSKTVTPEMVGDVILARTYPLEGELIEDMADLKKNMLFVRSEADPDRMNAILPPNRVNQFVTFAAAVQYRM